MPWVPAIIVLLAFSAIVGVFHGWLIAKIRMLAFVVNAAFLGYRGLAQTMTHDTAIGYYDAKFGIAGLEKLLTGEILACQPRSSHFSLYPQSFIICCTYRFSDATC